VQLRVQKREPLMEKRVAVTNHKIQQTWRQQVSRHTRMTQGGTKLQKMYSSSKVTMLRLEVRVNNKLQLAKTWRW
jgi:hypothetical protein